MIDHNVVSKTSQPQPEVDLSRFFNPRSVAFVGATEDVSKFGGKCVASLLKFGFQGSFMPVNPKRDVLFGMPCYPSMRELPEVPDHVGIALAGAAALDALEECGRLGVPFATVFSAGFTETGSTQGLAQQERLRDICARTGIRVMGPNCNGMVSFVDRFALTSTYAVSGGPQPAGDVAIASQSGGAGQINVMWRAMQAGLGISYQVSSGNDADLNLLDYIGFMLDSEATRVVLVVAERIASGRRLKELAERSARLDKPILMLKVGRSDAGRAAAASHTGSITGSDDVADAALSQWGIVRVDDTTDLYEYAKLFRRSRRNRGNRVSASSVSGGTLVMAVDLACQAGLAWPEFGPVATAGLKTLLPDFGTLRNPIDLTAAAVGMDDMLVQAGKQILADPSIDTFVPVVTMARRAEVEAVAEFALASDKQPVVLWTGGCVDDPSLRPHDLVRRGVPVFEDAARCFNAIAASARRATAIAGMERDAQHWRAFTGLPTVAEGNGTPVCPLGGGATLTERQSKQLLATYGLPATREDLAVDAGQAAAIAARIGRPVALKIESPDITHKTEAGAIRLHVRGEAHTREAFREVMAAARAYAPQADLKGVLVQEMVEPGVELVLGMINDPTFGPVVMVGAGGIYVEVFRDVARHVAPVTPDAAMRMLRSLRMWPILQGVRDQPGRDVESVVSAICALSRLSMEHLNSVAEIDINPLVVYPEGQGCRVVDALIVPFGDK
jgi:acetyltransferase